VYKEYEGNSLGLSVGLNLTADSAGAMTLTDTDANFSTTGDGLKGMKCLITSGPGIGEEKEIESNTSAVLTFASGWVTAPTSASTYAVAGISAHWRSKDYDFAGHDIRKLFRHVRVRPREDGNYSLTLNYIVDFKELGESTSASLSLLEDGFAFGTPWGERVWGGKKSIIKKVSLRSTNNQSTNGHHLALRFSNYYADQPFRITGYDIELKGIGRQ
jgi:hypothetical protein